ncbi:hypothetical protein I3843_11G082000 [Carya illinoinensis]|nr:hypothetical protein I3843_11G082000 [Carya illinoinensis]
MRNRPQTLEEVVLDMSTSRSGSMNSLMASLSTSFGKVPPVAVPTMLDCILASTSLPPSSLFASLLDAFPNLIKDIIEEDGKLGRDRCNYLTSLVGALCHLLKKLGANNNALQSFMSISFIPLLKLVDASDRELLNQIGELFINVVIETNSWVVVEENLVPLFVRFVGLSAGMLQHKESDAFECAVFKGLNELRNVVGGVKEHILSPSGPFPLPISCHILTLMLDASLQSLQSASISELIVANDYYAEKFAANLIWDLCNLTERLLLQSLEHRACTIHFFLPIIFKAFVSYRSFEISVHGQKQILLRKSFLEKIWKCCRTLFSLGTLERRDAYNVLSMYFSSLPCTEQCDVADTSVSEEEFDIRSEKEFWDEIKRGLVDKEGLVRKQSLQMLKNVLPINGGSQPSSVVSDTKLCERSIPRGMTKRELWADKEAKSMGIGKINKSADQNLNSHQQWEAFILLYEMLEEYGTHLVEAAWNHQVSLLLQFSMSHVNFASLVDGIHRNQSEIMGEIFNWLSILWERGFCHDNPQVRCLIMQSFLGIEWKNYGNSAKSVPETFVLGPFIQALNDPVHHKEFGVKGVYSSRIIEGAAQFLHQYTSCLNERNRIAFLSKLASAAKQQSFSRAGLMGLAECIALAACRNDSEADWCEDAFLDMANVETSSENFLQHDKATLLDILRFVIESSRQHFNPNYRFRVCDKVLEAAVSVVCVFEVPLEILLHFISTLPRELTDYGGSLRVKVQEWLLGCGKKHCSSRCYNAEVKLLKSLHEFPKKFTSCHCVVDDFLIYDDEDLDAWEFEIKRWARVLFLAIKEEHHLMPILKFIQNYGANICNQSNDMEWIPVKFLILSLSLVHELQIMHERAAEYGIEVQRRSEFSSPKTPFLLNYGEVAILFEKFAEIFLLILEELVSFANLSCSIYSSSTAIDDIDLPSSVRGKLGGPSQRRLSSSTTTAVLQAVTAVKSVAAISSWCAKFKSDVLLNFSSSFLWKFFLKTVSFPSCDSETGAEICVAGYEALAPALRALASVFSPQVLDAIRENDNFLLPKLEGTLLLDSLALSFLQNINNLLAVGVLARTRRAVLLNWKWLCLESLLSIPSYADVNGLHLEEVNCVYSEAALRLIFTDLVESLENAGEDSVLSMLRSVRLALGLFAKGTLHSVVSSCNGVDVQMMWHLVRSSWILHVSCNKRRVAPIAALLSSVLHSSVFGDENMHVTNKAPGPLKWLIENIIEEGKKSPRTIRLAALHLTGLWLSNPRTIKYYIKELKLLSLYGSVAFDEDFEAELQDNFDAKTEVSLLAKSADPELTEVFINTELYGRVSVAALFYKLVDLADMVGSTNETEDCLAALESGKLFLLELLDSVVNDKDLAKELYKKYSAIHRRKIRAWQMICVLSRFTCEDIVGQVIQSLHTSLCRNNLPAVRQYLETFAINIYLKFPSLVVEQLVPVLRDYDMRPQLLVYQVLCKLFPTLDSGDSQIIALEKRCFEDLKSYLAKNSDCVRLRASMEGYLDAYNPESSVTPGGIFVNRVEELEFECVPVSLMEQVLTFLNDVREDLRCSMARDVVIIKNESLRVDEDLDRMEISSNVQEQKLLSQQPCLDFQKKITLLKHEKKDDDVISFFGNKETNGQIFEMEKDDLLLDQLLQSRSLAMERIRASRQPFILVASLLDRIPNLAGLARTCEVFKASGLAIADASILRDKQFQLISVTAEKWVPIIEVPVNSVKVFLEKKKQEGFSILGLEQTANSIPLDQYTFPAKMVLVLGREKEGIPVDMIHVLDACIEIPQLGVVRSLNVHVSGAIALWEYTRQQRSK